LSGHCTRREHKHGPLAHDSYEDDERVIGLMVGGVGYGETDPKVAAECSWLETLAE
jgi:hypothetical protein